jgi:rod shape determining protein RodA
MMLGRSSPTYTVRGYSLPRPGAFAGRPRSLLARAFARNSVLRQMDWLLVLVVCGLSAIGVVLVWSATQPSLLAAGYDPHTYFKKQLLWAVIGLILMFAVSFVDSRRLRSWTPWVYGATLLALLAVLIPHIGSDVGGARAWINLPGGFQVEPSEFAKVALVLVLATVLSQARRATPGLGQARGDRPGLRRVLLALLAAAPLIALVVIEPALGVALVLIAVTATMIVLSGTKLRIIAGLAAVVGAVVALAGGTHLLKSYQLTRFTSFLHPSADLSGAGYNAAQAKIAVGSGGMFGTGLFHGSIVAGNFVPAQQTDFIFTVAGEELGFAGTITIVVLLFIVVVRALRVAARTEDLFGVLIASGVAIWFAFQSFVNIGMTIGITPITGLPLPFVSYGGSAIFADMIAIGMLQSVRRHHRVFE